MSYSTNSFPLKKSGAGKTTGTHTGNIVVCVTSGSITFNWKDGGTYTESMLEGMSYDLEDCTSVTITSGLFNIA